MGLVFGQDRPQVLLAEDERPVGRFGVAASAPA
jgi:hypothetical protein